MKIGRDTTTKIILTAAVSALIAFGIIAEITSRFAQPESTYDGTAFGTWKTYADNTHHYSFQYPSDFIFSSTPDYYIDDVNRVFLRFPDSLTLPSISGVSIDAPSSASFGASTSATSTCYHIDGIESGSNAQKPSKVAVNNEIFDFLRAGGCGAGDCDDVYQYSHMRNGICYRADLIIISGAPLYSTTTPAKAEVDRDDQKEEQVIANLKAIFQKMLSTLKFN